MTLDKVYQPSGCSLFYFFYKEWKSIFMQREIFWKKMFFNGSWMFKCSPANEGFYNQVFKIQKTKSDHF